MEINPVKGTHDIVASEADKYHEIENRCRFFAELFAYKEIRTPIIEHTPLFLRSVGESSDIVNKEMYTFNDKGGRSLTLRPEMTAGVMRSIVTNKLYANADFPLKYFYIGPCFRYERPQAGRYRQFHQFGIEAIGAPNYHQDVEAVVLGYHIIETLGLKKVHVLINSLGDEESRNNYREALRKYFADKIENMCPDCKRRLEVNPLRILDCKVPEDIEIVKGAPKLSDYLSKESKLYLDSVIAELKVLGIECEIDNNLVRGLDYYTGIVFEYHAKMGEDAKDVGALGGGGHYAHLLKDIGGPDLEGVGLSLGLERLAYIYDLIHADDEKPVFYDSVDFYVMGLSESNIDKCVSLCDLIRREGMSCEQNYEVKSIKSLFKTADRKKAKFAIIVGDDEIKTKTVKVKNLVSQTQTDVKMDDLGHVLHSLLQEYLETIYAKLLEDKGE